MYKRILVPLENTPYDAAILAHIRKLARATGASLLLIHVADGWAARNMAQLELRESEELRADREYLKRTADDLERDGYKVDAVLAGGDPVKEIIDAAMREHCDLIAMSTHGHRFLKDVLFGSVAEGVRHRCTIPVLLVRGSASPDIGPPPA
jgi:nucleotide-binding universal stress UspA family protein